MSRRYRLWPYFTPHNVTEEMSANGGSLEDGRDASAKLACTAKIIATLVLTCSLCRDPLSQSSLLLSPEDAPDISVVGYDGDWYAGRDNVQMTCKANANPPAHHFRWIRCGLVSVTSSLNCRQHKTAVSAQTCN